MASLGHRREKLYYNVVNPIHHALLDTARHPDERSSAVPRPLPPLQLIGRIVEAAEAHRLDGLLLREWEAAGVIGRLPEAESTACAESLKRLRLRSALVEMEWPRLWRALRGGGIDPVALKGIHIAQRFYPESVSRQLRDIDILVERAELRATVRILLGLGYRCLLDRDRLRGYLRHHFHLQLHHPHGFVVEVHWNLTRPASTFRLAGELVRADARRTRGADGLDILAPSLEHSILMVVLQNVQEGFANLARTVDLDRLVRSGTGPDWKELIEAAAPGHLSKPLALSLQIARKSLKTPVPPEVLRALGVRGLSRIHIALFRPVRFLMNRRATKRTSASSLLRLWLFPGIRRRVRMLVSLVSDRFLDPLDWVWKNQPEAGAIRGRGVRLATAMKLVVYQGYLYARGILGWLRRDRDQVGFWD